RSLPEQVFVRPKEILFNHFYFMLDEESWSQLQYLAQKNNDQNIYVADVAILKKKNWSQNDYIITLPININKEDYIEILDKNSIIVESEQIVWFSESTSWGIWAQRAWDLCLVNSMLNEGEFFNWEKLNTNILSLIQD